MQPLRSLSIALVVSLCACGAPDPDDDGADGTGSSELGGVIGSCFFPDYADSSACVGYYDEKPEERDIATACEESNGVYASLECPDEDAIGYCAYAVHVYQTRWTYYAGQDLDLVEGACATAGGDWSAP